MDDTEYEYESPSDSDDEAVGTETFWHEMHKRIKCHTDEIHITLEANDDTSVLNTVLDTIDEGISSQTIAVQCQIEHLHNAIVQNPSARKGPQRLRDIKRLQALVSPALHLRHVTHLTIPNAEDYVPTHVRRWAARLPRLTHVTLSKPTMHTMQALCVLPNVEHLSIAQVTCVPSFYAIKQLNTLTLAHFKRLRDISAVFFMHRVAVRVQHCMLREGDALLLRAQGNVVYDDVTVETVDGPIPHEAWLARGVLRF